MPHDRWHGIWARRGWRARLLWPVSCLYAALGAVRRWLYRAGLLTVHRLPVPVVVVGNVVVGGAGKTPTVIALVEHLRAHGWQPGVVSRGYGREGHAVLAVTGATPASASGDEPALIHQRTGAPVFVAPRRADAARALLAAHPGVDILLCDDGLQHLSLGRDVSVAVFDERGTGNGWQLPAGLLREPWPPGRMHPCPPDLMLLQRRAGQAAAALPASGVPAFDAVRRLSEQAHDAQGRRAPLASLRGQPLIAVAGIARPQAFFDMLTQSGLHIARPVPLADHAAPADYRALNLQAGDTVICTEKDAVKLFPVLPPGVSAWTVALELAPQPAFWQAFDALLARHNHRR